jgi:hypothetical protein
LAGYFGVLRRSPPDCTPLNPDSVEMILCQEEGMASAAIDVLAVGTITLISLFAILLVRLRS